MRILLLYQCAILLSLFGSSSAFAATEEQPDSDASQVSFSRDVAPILVKNCQACHGPKKPEGDYQVHTFAHLMKAGASELPAVVPGDPEESELYRLITDEDPSTRMPLEADKLPDDQIARVRRWIEQGAKLDTPDPNAALVSIIPSEYPEPPAAYSAALPITALEFSPDGKELAVSGYYEATIWNAQTGELQRRLKNVPQRVLGLSYSPDGSRLAVGGGNPGQSGEVIVLDAATGEVLLTAPRVADTVLDVAFSPDGKNLAAGGADRAIHIYDATTAKELTLIEAHADWVMDLDWSDDGKQIASAGRDKSSKLFDAETGAIVGNYAEHDAPAFSVALSADGKQIFAGDSEPRLHVWNAATGKKSADVRGFGGPVLQIIAEGDSIFTCASDKTVRQHQASDRKPVREYAGHDVPVASIAFHSGSKRLASGTFAGQIHVWNAEDGAGLVKFLAVPGRESPGAQ